jgi:hypothetical protein
MVVLLSSIRSTAEYQCVLKKWGKWLTTKWYEEKSTIAGSRANADAGIVRQASVWDARYRMDLPHLALPFAAS